MPQIVPFFLFLSSSFRVTVTPPSTPSAVNNCDLVEDVLQQCKRNAEERKKKILAAYEAAARSAPAGVIKGVDFEPFINADG